VRDVGPETIHHTGTLRLSLAGAFAGIAAGGFLVAVMSFLQTWSGWRLTRCEPAAALLGALGVWCFTPAPGARRALGGVAAALFAMLLGDAFRVAATMSLPDWVEIPERLRVSLALVDWRHWWHYWPRLLRYGFGMYAGWYLCSAVAAPVFTTRLAGREDNT